MFVLDLLLVALALLDARGLRAPEPLCAALIHSAHALWAQLGDDEPEPRYGDSDDGRALVLDASDVRSARGVAAAIAARFGDRGAARVAGALDPTSIWLFGTAGAQRFEAAASHPAPAPESLTLPDGGLTVLRGGGCRTLFDHGPHGYLTLAAHGHADALAIDVALHEQPLVSDPGVGSYFAQPEVREAFRGTGFHATVTVDGVSSSEPGGPFLWTRHARSTLLHFDPEGAAIAEHDGYTRLADPVVHRRAVVLIGNEGASSSSIVCRRSARTGTRSAGRSIRRSTSRTMARDTSSCAASTQVRSSSSPNQATSTFASRADRRARGSGGGRTGSSRSCPPGWHRWISRQRARSSSPRS